MASRQKWCLICAQKEPQPEFVPAVFVVDGDPVCGSCQKAITDNGIACETLILGSDQERPLRKTDPVTVAALALPPRKPPASIRAKAASMTVRAGRNFRVRVKPDDTHTPSEKPKTDFKGKQGRTIPEEVRKSILAEPRTLTPGQVAKLYHVSARSVQHFRQQADMKNTDGKTVYQGNDTTAAVPANGSTQPAGDQSALAPNVQAAMEVARLQEEQSRLPGQEWSQAGIGKFHSGLGAQKEVPPRAEIRMSLTAEQTQALFARLTLEEQAQALTAVIFSHLTGQ